MSTKRNGGAGWLALLLIVAFAPACNRLGAAGGDDKATADGKAFPFHSDPGAEPNVPGDADRSGLAASAKQGLPFHSLSHSRILPSGTLITVRLERPLTSKEVHPGDVFTALVAEPVMIDGETVVARGTVVTGAIEGSQESPAPQIAGYIRLTLSAITVDGKPLPLQTSSLFAKGTPSLPEDKVKAMDAGVRLPQGRRLTFRLTIPAALDVQNSIADRHDPIPSVQ